MKRSFYLFAVCLLLGFSLGWAQTPLTLDQGNFPNNQTTQVIHVATTAPNPPLTAGANQTLDYSGIGNAGPITLEYGHTSPDFPTADYGYSNLWWVGTGFDYDVFEMQQVSASGYMQIGRDIPEQVNSLTGLTGGLDDYDSIPAQTNQFTSTPFTLLPFPVSAGDSWSSVWDQKLDLYLFVPLFSLNGAHTEIFTEVSATNSIIGWGTLQVPNAAGNGGTPPVDVLIEERIVTAVDSFYLDGQLADPFLLFVFGVDQGQSTTFKEYNVWRADYSVPLLTVRYSVVSPNLPSEVWYHPALVAGREELSLNQAILFPNPMVAGNNQLNLLLEGNVPNQLQFELRDLSGKLLERQTVQPHGNPLVSLELGSAPASGMYLVNLLDEEGQTVFSRKWMVN